MFSWRDSVTRARYRSEGILHQGLQGWETGRERGGTGSQRAEPWLRRAETQPGEKLPPSPRSAGPSTGGCSPKAPGGSWAGWGDTGAWTRHPSAPAPSSAPSQDSQLGLGWNAGAVRGRDEARQIGGVVASTALLRWCRHHSRNVKPWSRPEYFLSTSRAAFATRLSLGCRRVCRPEPVSPQKTKLLPGKPPHKLQLITTSLHHGLHCSELCKVVSSLCGSPHRLALAASLPVTLLNLCLTSFAAAPLRFVSVGPSEVGPRHLCQRRRVPGGGPAAVTGVKQPAGHSRLLALVARGAGKQPWTWGLMR